MAQRTTVKKIFFAMLSFSVSFADVLELNLAEEGQSSSGAAQDPEVIELYNPVLQLNKFSFHKSVLQERGSEVAHWIVMFCPTWYEPCQALQPLYRQLSEQWQDRLNTGLLSTEVRFANVDCATEKELCNTQKVGMNYPYVAHYKEHKKVAFWKGKSFKSDQKRLGEFLQKELGSIDSTMKIGLETEAEAAENNFNIPVDFLLICAAILGNAVFISRGSFAVESSKPSDPKSALSHEGNDADSSTSNSASCRARTQSQSSLEL